MLQKEPLCWDEAHDEAAPLEDPQRYTAYLGVSSRHVVEHAVGVVVQEEPCHLTIETQEVTFAKCLLNCWKRTFEVVLRNLHA